MNRWLYTLTFRKTHRGSELALTDRKKKNRLIDRKTNSDTRRQVAGVM